MKDKIVLITGSSDGVGKQSAIELAEMGAMVIIHGRNKEKTEKALEEIKQKSNSTNVDMFLADLSSLNQIREMSRQIHDKYERIDVLINNAGVQMHIKEISEDGFEMTFAVNQLAYFLLTSELLDLVDKSEYRRIIIVASQLHSDNIDFDNLQAEKEFSLYPIYAQSKLCNLLFAYQLAKRLENKGITVNCLHPGLIDTNLNPKRSSEVVNRALPVSEGSISTVYLATSSEVNNKTGGFYMQDASEGKSREKSYDAELQLKLWNVCEEMIGEKFKLI